MDYRTLAQALTAFIQSNEEVTGLWNGKDSNQFEEPAMTASHLIELAQPLLDELKDLIADEDFVPPQAK